ncbi:MAG TPA: DUF1330 domain-containing protein [bacterium]
MAAYVIGQVHIAHQEQYEAYQKQVPATLEKYNGKFLVRGGPVEHLEGSWPVTRMVLLEFDSVESARAWYNSTEYKIATKARVGAATITLTLLQGV